MIDPTGRSIRPFNPSQVTEIVDHSFGTGKNPRKDEGARQVLIDQVKGPAEHAGIKDLGEFGRHKGSLCFPHLRVNLLLVFDAADTRVQNDHTHVQQFRFGRQGVGGIKYGNRG